MPHIGDQAIISSFASMHFTALLNTVEEGFMKYEEISPETWKNAKIGEWSFRMNFTLGFLKTDLPIYTQTAITILVILHSNAGKKRVSSIIDRILVTV